ncbi:methyltransferase family protein [Rathayibacter tanaceti]|uniref:Malonyl-[acyl-carrier protein] O-methyltransferase n=3 Tax=Rathayibacter tanaceti TaxID=1671680 RepID=A0A166IL78_9MICO|nr:Malonyl-[acyl-carrier protein] O-methyltransferase [Rathayibacter tanaceti]QHC56905.1 methyltransferase domain-containing protein [Rathayibacter tanaceti]TCO37420.1 methyltransferase family protein [Rathayibacter tanaceti]
MTIEVQRAYAERAEEYSAALGSIEAMHPEDVARITGWAAAVAGPLLDAGSGPGHWTDLLRHRGSDVTGIELVPEFVDSARRRFPLADYDVGDLRSLPYEDARFAGVLAWYSVIHTPPEQCPPLFRELARVLRPGGSLLIGAFLGPSGEPFKHAITGAFFWSERGLSDALAAAGLEVTESHSRSTPPARPHLAVVARMPAPPDRGGPAPCRGRAPRS